MPFISAIFGPSLIEKVTKLKSKLEIESLQKDMLTFTFMNEKDNLEAEIVQLQ